VTVSTTDTGRILWLSNRDVTGLLTLEQAKASVARALLHHARGAYQQPLKPYIRPGGRENEHSRGRFIFMPAYLGGDVEAVGIKIISGFPINVERQLPRASGVYVLSSTDTGFPLAVMACAELSARRTGATAAICFDLFAGSGDHVVGVLGAGPIAEASIDALIGASGVTQVVIHDRWHERALALAAKYRDAAASVVAEPSMSGCLDVSTVLVLATVGSSNYLTPTRAGRKRLIVALSLDDATPDLFLSADKMIVDSFEDCCREEKLLHRLVQAGRFSPDCVHAELGQVLDGCRPARERDDELVYCNLMGMGIEDLAVAAHVYQTALVRGVGQWLAAD
jgi:ornithine cyclodeaminase